MEDYIVRATAAEGSIRALAAVTTNMVRHAGEIHKLSPVACAALGRTMTAAALMTMQLKGFKDVLTIQIKGDGPLGGIVVVTDFLANIRGYVHNPDVDLPLNKFGKLDVAGAVGSGYLNIIKDIGLKEPYIGYVKLVSGEIAEDLAYYFANSEQVPSIVALGVLIGPDGSVINAGGYIIQLMPDAQEEIIDFLERKIAAVPAVTKMLAEGASPQSMLETILGEKNIKFFDTFPCQFECNCSRDRMERNLLSIGEKDLREIIEEQQGAELQCHFCNQKYWFSKEDLLKLIEPESE